MSTKAEYTGHKVQFGCQIPEDLYWRLKEEAVKQRKRMREIVVEALTKAYPLGKS